MPCPLVGRTKLSHRIRYFFIWSFVAAHVTCSKSEWGYRGFLWTKGTPKYISRNRAALVNISREQGNKPNFGGSESGNLENSSMHWPYAFVIVHRQSHCFDALLIIKRVLMTGWPRTLENRENGEKKFPAGKNQGIWNFAENQGKIREFKKILSL